MERTDGRFNDLVAEAVKHHEAGRLTEADAVYRAALALSPGHAAVTQNLGVIAATLGQHDAAIARFDEVIAREPAHVPAHYNRAAALQALGRTQDAIKGFSRVCTLEPGPMTHTGRSAFCGSRSATEAGHSIILRAPMNCDAGKTGWIGRLGL